jgi:hypothetical protein
MANEKWPLWTPTGRRWAQRIQDDLEFPSGRSGERVSVLSPILVLGLLPGAKLWLKLVDQGTELEQYFVH